MTHSDDKGLVVPPKLSPTEAVLIPIFKNKNKEQVLEYAQALFEKLHGRFKVQMDDDDANSPGWKFSEWEMLGVPVRVEIGPRDMEKGQVMLVRRDNGEKEAVSVDAAPDRLAELLKEIQQALFDRAKELQDRNTYRLSDWEEFKRVYEGEGGFVRSYWCGDTECEAAIKDETKATIRVLPFDQEVPEGACCVRCGNPAAHEVIFAKAY
jgi:prolyl-tRNA synthetase